MEFALDASIGQLVAQAEKLSLLKDHRMIGGFVYLDVGERRFVLDEPMGRSFLLGLLAGCQHPVVPPLTDSRY